MNEKSMTVTEASRNFADVINRARYRQESVLLLKNGKPMARIIPVVPLLASGRDLAEAWKALPHLGKNDAALFGNELKAARKALPKVRSPWEE